MKKSSILYQPGVSEVKRSGRIDIASRPPLPAIIYPGADSQFVFLLCRFREFVYISGLPYRAHPSRWLGFCFGLHDTT